MAQKINKIQKELNQFKKQRNFWIKLSLGVVITVTTIILEWNEIKSYHLEWVVASTGLIMSMTWWYWTMRLIRQLIDHRNQEVELISELISDIKSIKDEVAKLKK